MDVNDQRRKLHLGLRSLQTSALDAIARDCIARPAQVWDKASPAGLLWESLLQPDCRPNPSLAAATGRSIVGLVQKGSLDWQKTLNQILQRLATVPTVALPYVVRTVAQLLVLHSESHDRQAAEEGTTTHHNTYKSPFGQSGLRPHPFITLTTTRPEAWADVLFEVKRMTARRTSATILLVLDPFVRHVCSETALEQVAASGQNLAQLLRSLVDSPTAITASRDEGSEAFASSLLDLHLDILSGLPVVVGEDVGTQLMLCENISVMLGRDTSTDGISQSVYQLLNFAFDCHAAGLSLSAPLSNLHLCLNEDRIRDLDPSVTMVLFAGLSFCLLDVPEYQVQGSLIVQMLLSLVKHANPDEPQMRAVLPVAVFPLLQAISEISDGLVKRKVFDILLILERSVLRKPTQAHACSTTPALCLRPSGTCAVLMSRLHMLGAVTARSDRDILILHAIDPQMSVFLFSALAFHDDERVRIKALKACTELTFPTAAAYMALLPLLLYVLKDDPSSEVKCHVLLRNFPALVAANDAFVTARTLHVVQSLLPQSPDSAYNTLACVGVRVLLEIWKRQPRVWPSLKAHLVPWVRRRRHGRPANYTQHGTWSDEAEMEITVLSTIRDACDACQTKPTDCGEDLLPHLFSLLDASDLPGQTIALALESINLCLNASITDPRAAWNVCMRSFVTRIGVSAADEVLLQTCGFYKLVAVKDDPAEVYTIFKTEVLTGHLIPLLDHRSGTVRDAAYLALASYPPPDLFALLPPPMELVATSTKASKRSGNLLANFIRHECKHMRRAVFKGLAAAAGGRIVDAPGTDPSEQLRKQLNDVASDLRQTWEGGRAPAGLRSGLAAFSLMVTPTTAEKSALEVGAGEAKLPFSRNLASAIRDLSLSDHIIVRLEAVPTWTKFWDSAIVASYKTSITIQVGQGINVNGEKEKLQTIHLVESMVVATTTDLLTSRLAESRLPSNSVNIILAVTGLLVAASALGLTVAQSQAGRCADVLMQQYANHTGHSTETLTDSQRSDEIQFAVGIALSHLAKVLHSNDEVRLRAIAAVLTAGVAGPQSEDQELQQFANAYGLVTVAATTSAVAGIEATISACLSGDHGRLARRGAEMGSASIPTTMDEGQDLVSAKKLMSDAWTTVDAFSVSTSVDDENLLDNVEGAAWILSAAVGTKLLEPSELDKYEASLDLAVATAASRRNAEALYSHLLVAYVRVSHARLSQKEPGILAAQLSATVARACSSSVNASTRIACLLSICPFLGINWLDGASADGGLEKDVPTIRRTVDSLRGLAVGPDPKIARIAGWVLGKVVSHLSLEDSARKELMGSAGEIVAGKKDPMNYNRLHQGSSYLRAVYDSLASNGGAAVTKETAAVLIEALVLVDAPLPPADWNPVLPVLQRLDSDQTDETKMLDAKHATAASPKSLVAIYVSKLEEFINSLSSTFDFANQTYGIPKLLELGGMGRTEKSGRVGETDTSTPRATAVASTKILQLFKSSINTFVAADSGKQSRFIKQILPHFMVDTARETSETTSFLRLDLLCALISAYRRLDDIPKDDEAVVTVRGLMTCIASDLRAVVEFMNELPDPNATAPTPWTPKSLWAVGRLTELAVLHAESRPWLAESLARVSGQSGSGTVPTAIVQVSRAALLHPESHVQNAWIRALVTNARRTAPEGEIRARLQWVVLLLDVAIMLCAASVSRGVDVAAVGAEIAWTRAIAGYIGLTPSIGKHTSDVSDIAAAVTDEVVWAAAGRETIALLPVYLQDERTGESTRKQVIKRLNRLLECTEDRSGKGYLSTSPAARVPLPSVCRRGMEEALLRLRHGESSFGQSFGQ
ncbi:hypothetical protein HKX48_003356 [Thoreauomyces humboldtii]|nr:hypothetical protein HKX48_003356 [Thoreauomyces humboldtii]